VAAAREEEVDKEEQERAKKTKEGKRVNEAETEGMEKFQCNFSSSSFSVSFYRGCPIFVS